MFDFFRIKKEETIDYRLDKLEEDVIAISNKLDLLINQLKIEFYKSEPYIQQLNESVAAAKKNNHSIINIFRW